MTSDSPTPKPVESRLERAASNSNEVVAVAAYEAGLSSLRDQRSELDAIRERGFKLLTLSGTVLSLLAATVLRDPPDDRTALFYSAMGLATSAFAVLVVLVVISLWPVREWFGRVSPEILVDSYASFSAAEAMKWLAIHAEESLTKNKESLRPRRLATEAAVICLGIEIVAVVLAAWLFV